MKLHKFPILNTNLFTLKSHDSFCCSHASSIVELSALGWGGGEGHVFLQSRKVRDDVVFSKKTVNSELLTILRFPFPITLVYHRSP